jgi:quercetin dioxygenase-like cupin family protein
MKINKISEIEEKVVDMPGAKDVTMKILVATNDGSKNIVMRYFRIKAGGSIPVHTHNYEHIIKIAKGKGLVGDEFGKEYEVNEGNALYVEPNKKHHYKNPFDQNFEFICIIPNQDK